MLGEGEGAGSFESGEPQVWRTLSQHCERGRVPGYADASLSP